MKAYNDCYRVVRKKCFKFIKSQETSKEKFKNWNFDGKSSCCVKTKDAIVFARSELTKAAPKTTRLSRPD